LGAHLNWQVGEQTTLEIDGSWSKAENNPGLDKGFFMNMGTRNVGVNPEWHLN